MTSDCLDQLCDTRLCPLGRRKRPRGVARKVTEGGRANNGDADWTTQRSDVSGCGQSGQRRVPEDGQSIGPAYLEVLCRTGTDAACRRRSVEGRLGGRGGTTSRSGCMIAFNRYVRGEGCKGDLGFGETGLTGRVVSELTDEKWTSVMVAIAMTMSSRRGIWCRMFCGSEGGRCGWRVGRDGGVCAQEGRALGEDYR